MKDYKTAFWGTSICLIISFCGLFNLRYELDKLKEENLELREKAKPTIRKYNEPKCNCKCSEE